MKKYIIGIVMIVIILIAAVYLMAEKQYEHGSASHILYLCNDKSYPTGQLSFYIELQNDGHHHLIIASKPPQTDIVVTKTELGLFNYEYQGNGVDIKDSTSSLQVNFDGKLIENCHKSYPGV